MKKIILPLSIALMIGSTCFATPTPFKQYENYIKKAKENHVKNKKYAVLGTVEQGRPGARVVSTFSSNNDFYFSSSSDSGQAKAIKNNPQISLTYLYMAPKFAASVVVYGIAKKTGQQKLNNKKESVYWQQYRVKPVRYKFSLRTLRKKSAIKRYSKQTYNIHLLDYQLVNNQWKIVRNKDYP